MVSLVLATVWHFWLSIALLIPMMGLLVALGVGYIVKVVANKYPRRS